MAGMPLDFESRAHRFLGAMSAVEDMLSASAPGLTVHAEPMAYLICLLREEAERVVVPTRLCANDDHDEL